MKAWTRVGTVGIERSWVSLRTVNRGMYWLVNTLGVSTKTTSSWAGFDPSLPNSIYHRQFEHHFLLYGIVNVDLVAVWIKCVLTLAHKPKFILRIKFLLSVCLLVLCLSCFKNGRHGTRRKKKVILQMRVTQSHTCIVNYKVIRLISISHWET